MTRRMVSYKEMKGMKERQREKGREIKLEGVFKKETEIKREG